MAPCGLAYGPPAQTLTGCVLRPPNRMHGCRVCNPSQPPLWGAPRASLPRETGSVLEWGRSSIADLLKGSPVEGIAYELNNDVTEAVRWLVAEMPKSRPPTPPPLSCTLDPRPCFSRYGHHQSTESAAIPRNYHCGPSPSPLPRPLLRSSAECRQSVPPAAPTHAFLWNPMPPPASVPSDGGSDRRMRLTPFLPTTSTHNLTPAWLSFSQGVPPPRDILHTGERPLGLRHPLLPRRSPHGRATAPPQGHSVHTAPHRSVPTADS